MAEEAESCRVTPCVLGPLCVALGLVSHHDITGLMFHLMLSPSLKLMLPRQQAII